MGYWILAFVPGLIALFYALRVEGYKFWEDPTEKEAESALCGKCRYPTRGNSTPNCPECGADLRLVGVTYAVRKRRLASTGWIALWLLALALPAVWSTKEVQARSPQHGPWFASVFLVANFSSNSVCVWFETDDANGGFRNISPLRTSSQGQGNAFITTIDYALLGRGFIPRTLGMRAGSGWAGYARPGQEPDYPGGHLDIDPVTMGYRYKIGEAPEVLVKSPIDASGIQKWWDGVRFSPRNPPAAADEVLNMIHGLSKGQTTFRLTQLGSNSTQYATDSTHGPRWLPWAMVLAWSVVALCGVGVIKRRKRPTARQANIK
jgi:hypothetical protein